MMRFSENSGFDRWSAAVIIHMVGVFCLALAVSTVARGQVENNLQDGTKQSGKAAQVFREIMDMPDKSIPLDLLDGAACVAVFPSVFNAAGVFGGRGGRRRKVSYQPEVLLKGAETKAKINHREPI